MAMVYVAANLGLIESARGLAQTLRSSGHKVRSNWHEDPRNTREYESALTRQTRRQLCEDNMRDLQSADTVLAIISPAIKGTIVEVAVAWSWGKRVLCVGDPMETTLMLDLPGIEWFARANDALAAIQVQKTQVLDPALEEALRDVEDLKKMLGVLGRHARGATVPEYDLSRALSMADGA